MKVLRTASLESNFTGSYKKECNILLTRNLPVEPGVRQWSHPLIILLHCLWAKSNNRTRGQFECDVTWFCFCFHFVRSYARSGCCSVVCLRFQVVQIKQVDCKWVLKMWIIINKRHFLIFSDNCTHKNVKPRRRRYNSEASAKWKEIKGKPDKINGLILKTKADLKEGPNNI